jgi:zinc and cadmium transporter
MAPEYQLAFYALLIMTASMAGWLAPAMMRFSHRRLHLLMSLVAGLMLGVGVFHMLPHAAIELKSIDIAVRWLMGGLLGMFFLMRAFHFHQHVSLEPNEADAPGTASEHAHGHCGHDHDHDHGQGDKHAGHGDIHPAHKLSWAGIGLGLTLHTLIDGIALAASVADKSALDGGQQLFVGVGTFLAIALHKPLDAMSITTLMASGGWSKSWRLAVNVAFAAMCPIGVVLFFIADQLQLLSSHNVLVGAALAFSAGVFLCISLSDLLPEIQFHDHDRVQLSAALLTGVLVAYGIGFIEPDHVHSSQQPVPGSQARERGH